MKHKPYFFNKYFPDVKRKRYSEQEIIFHLEILPINKQSAILRDAKEKTDKAKNNL